MLRAVPSCSMETMETFLGREEHEITYVHDEFREK
jgi:hypothetical protein